MLNKLKRKFISVNIFCITIILTLVFIAVCIVTYRTERENIIRGLHLAADKIILAESSIDDDENTLFDSGEPDFSTLTIFFDESGEIIEIYTDEDKTDPKPVLYSVAERIEESDKTEGILWDYSLFFVKGSIGGRSYAAITSGEVLRNNIRTITRAAGMILFACLLLFIALSYFLASVAIKPVKETWEGQKRFIADASHDMKTPLTVILANTEIIKTHAGTEESKKWLSSTKAEAERMKRLVDSMLELSSTEFSDERVVLSEINFSEITERTVLQMEAVAFDKSTYVESNIAKGVIIKGNEDRLSRLLHILIDNGIKYANKDSTLRVSLVKGKRFAKLTVTNEGSYINEDDIPRLFERFYRGDKARSGGGFGLGLAIAKNLTESMGGTISAENKKDVGATFTASFPLSDRLLAKIFYQRR